MIPYPGDTEYAATRLNETVVMYGGNPVEVRRIFTAGRMDALPAYYEEFGKPLPKKRLARPVAIVNLLSGDRDIVELDKLDVNPVPLGYVNYQRIASYITRMPRRGDYRQGMRYGNIRSVSGLPADRIPYSSIAKCIINDFPTFQQVQEMMKAKLGKSMAWHREWCLHVDGSVSHEGEVVGRLLEGRVALEHEKKYLQEALDESF